MHIVLLTKDYVRQLQLVDWWCCSGHLCLHFPHWLTISDMGMWKSPMLTSLSLCFMGSWTHCFVGGCTYVKDYYAFLEKWPLYYDLVFIWELFLVKSVSYFDQCYCGNLLHLFTSMTIKRFFFIRQHSSVFLSILEQVFRSMNFKLIGIWTSIFITVPLYHFLLVFFASPFLCLCNFNWAIYMDPFFSSCPIIRFKHLFSGGLVN